MPKSSKAPKSPPSNGVFEGLASAKDMADLGLEQFSHLPLAKDEPDRDCYLVSFELYNHDLCQIYGLHKSRAKKTIIIFKRVLTEVRSDADIRQLYPSVRRIEKRDAYRHLYDTIPEEGEVWEIKISDKSRLFYYPKEADSLFYVVAVMENHREADKVVR